MPYPVINTDLNTELPTGRIILKTLDGQVIVKPDPPESFDVGELVMYLNPAGKLAWAAGKPVLDPKHIGFVMNRKAVEKGVF